jgi:hypothetical protein
MTHKYHWGALKTYKCPITANFVNHLEESSWGACNAQTINYIIMDSVSSLPLEDIKYVICDSDTDGAAVARAGAIPVYVRTVDGPLLREGAMITTADIDGVLGLLRA